MKKRLFCLVLACLMLVGCSSKTTEPQEKEEKTATPSGDMEQALIYLKWQDFKGAIDEANAFLARVPHSVPAKNVRETASWSLLDVSIDENTVKQLEKGNFMKISSGFAVRNLPEDTSAEFCLTGYDIVISSSWDYFDLDFSTERIYLTSLVIYWKYPNSEEHKYILYDLTELKKTDIGNYWRLNYGGDKMSSSTHEKFAEYLVTAFVPSLDGVFSLLEREYNIKPEYIGFENWNQSA